MNVMRTVSIKLARMIVVLSVMAALMLGGAGAALAACSYSMTNVAEVAPGSTNTPIGSLVITFDAATAQNSAGSFVDFSLPAQPSGFVLTVTGSSLINATGSVSVINIDLSDDGQAHGEQPEPHLRRFGADRPAADCQRPRGL